jgi:hypothetical protein
MLILHVRVRIKIARKLNDGFDFRVHCQFFFPVE